MDCQLGSRLRALISLISREPTWIRRALPRAVPQCGHGWKDSRDEDFAIPRKMPLFPFGQALAPPGGKHSRVQQRQAGSTILTANCSSGYDLRA
jgi:hypothetical protein